MSTPPIVPAPADTPARDEFYERISTRHMRPREDAVLFSFSDRPIQDALHLFREDRGHV